MTFFKKSDEYLSYESSKSLIIYDEMSPGVLRAKDYRGHIGLVEAKNIEFYPGFEFSFTSFSTT